MRRIHHPAAHGLPIEFRWKSPIVLPNHLEDVAEAFVRLTLADATRYPTYTTGGTPTDHGNLATLVQRLLPYSQITLEDPVA